MWPFNAKAAVSITYDDGHPSNLDLAIPDLEDRGFRGTFYLTPELIGSDRVEEWRQACRSGHEIGNHTWNHPCAALPTFESDQFTLEQTGKTEHWLNENIGYFGVKGRADDLRTYAYICGELQLGGGGPDVARLRYLELVRSTFWAARTTGGEPQLPEEVRANPYEISARATTWDYDRSDRSIDYCKSALSEGRWAVLILHSITNHGETTKAIDTSRQVHIEILDFLAENTTQFWVAPLREVYRHILSSDP